ncbi:MAG: dihydropteroate synthase [Dehalococcoidia bacterium]|nr:dihydropteroate synthase [Dehalococcoidia bacterium]
MERSRTRIGPVEFIWGSRTYIMGVLNVAPDSFSGDGTPDVEQAIARGKELAQQGADIIDVGGESTRPDYVPVSLEEETRRVVPVIEALAAGVKVPVSIDTYKSGVACRAVEAGARMINDVWGLKQDPDLARVAAEYDVPLVITQNQRGASFTDFFPELVEDMRRSVDLALRAGVRPENIIMDPGVGFGKTVDQNLEIIRRLGELREMGFPVLLGTSRKSFIGLVLHLPVNDRLEGTAASVAIGIAHGADLVRVHDVSRMVRIARMSDAIVRGR